MKRFKIWLAKVLKDELLPYSTTLTIPPPPPLIKYGYPETVRLKGRTTVKELHHPHINRMIALNKLKNDLLDKIDEYIDVKIIEPSADHQWPEIIVEIFVVKPKNQS